jgi:hypothetical protein
MVPLEAVAEQRAAGQQGQQLQQLVQRHEAPALAVTQAQKAKVLVVVMWP